MVENWSNPKEQHRREEGCGGPFPRTGRRLTQEEMCLKRRAGVLEPYTLETVRTEGAAPTGLAKDIFPLKKRPQIVSRLLVLSWEKRIERKGKSVV